jgi:hypothetical protein
VAHAYNLGYPRGRDQEDYGSKPSLDNISKKTHHTKKGLVEWLKA